MIKVEHVSLTIKKQEILKDVSLEVNRGEAVGLVGGNGSGKTMLMKCICGIHRSFLGKIIVLDKRICKELEFPPQTGFIIEAPGFLPYLNGYENLKVLADIKEIIGKKEIMESMELVGLDPKEKKSVKKYSLGMKQRLGLAQALMEKPQILILDEPFNGLDKHMVEKMRQVLIKQKQEGKTILLASHNEKDIEYICDRTYEIDGGRMIFEQQL